MRRRATYRRPPRSAPSAGEFVAAMTFAAVALGTLAYVLVWVMWR